MFWFLDFQTFILETKFRKFRNWFFNLQLFVTKIIFEIFFKTKQFMRKSLKARNFWHDSLEVNPRLEILNFFIVLKDFQDFASIFCLIVCILTHPAFILITKFSSAFIPLKHKIHHVESQKSFFHATLHFESLEHVRNNDEEVLNEIFIDSIMYRQWCIIKLGKRSQTENLILIGKHFVDLRTFHIKLLPNKVSINFQFCTAFIT